MDVEVVTREVWTLVPGFSFHSSGGDNSVEFGLRDSNAFGTGQRASAFYSSDTNRNSYKLAFENPNIGNTHRVVKTQAENSADGFLHLVDYALAYNISQIYRTEDLSLGSNVRFSVGYDPAGDRRIVLQGEAADTLLSQRKMLLQWRSDWYGRWNQNDNAWEDSLVNFDLDFHRGQTAKRTLYLGFSASKAIHLNSAQRAYTRG